MLTFCSHVSAFAAALQIADHKQTEARPGKRFLPGNDHYDRFHRAGKPNRRQIADR